MATFVLVHGAWHGGWCWGKVAPLLRAAGHQVFAPTLTGLGERSHLFSPAIGLSTHIQDVVNVLVFEDLHDVILVGHSYGGIVITGVADRMRARIARLVYLDAFVAEDGASWRALRNAPLPQEGAPAIPPRPLADFGVTAEADIDWAAPRLTPQPAQTAVEPLKLTDPNIVSAFPRTYIRCLDYAMPAFAALADRISRDPAWTYRAMNTGHDAMITAPAELSALLLEAAAGMP
jgi:pimeloyl-ACP methyl ester carboxylesterase